MLKKNIFLLIITIICLKYKIIYAQNKKIGKIKFSGNDKTSESVLNSVINIKEGDEFSNFKIEMAIQNLKNTTVFSSIHSEVTADPKNQNSINILFKVEEKWTMIPYLIFGSGGGSNYYAIGIFDSNFLGRLYTTNLNFKIENDEPNISFNFIKNYTIDLNLITGMSAQFNSKKEIFYNSDNQINGYLSYQETRINPYALWKFCDYFLLGGGISFEESSNINNDLSADEIGLNKKNNIKNQNSFATVSLQTRMTLGKINYENLSQNGAILTSIANSTAGMYQSNSQGDDFTSFNNTILAFYNIYSLKNSYFAFRLGSLITTSENPIRQYYVGGLDKLRGFNYSQFNGKSAFFNNYEFRYTAWTGNYIALQLVPFFDLGNVGNALNQVFGQQSATSYGFGIRIPFIKINKIAFRLDYATTLTPYKMTGISFGLTQFF